MGATGKTHHDYQEIIGGTAATAENYIEKRWNHYYFKTFTNIVSRMINDESAQGRTILDLGTSHGNWYNFLKGQGFKEIIGVELDARRAELARARGYQEVFNCDAANIPRDDSSVDVVVSNDVFVHILQLEDKIAVIKEVLRLLKPGGIFIFNHPMSRAFGFGDNHIEGHCSFLSLNQFIRSVAENTELEFIDIKPTYYTFSGRKPCFAGKLIRLLFLLMPFGVSLRYYFDYRKARNLSLEQADSVYLKLRK